MVKQREVKNTDIMIVQITMRTNQDRIYEIPALYVQTHCLDNFVHFSILQRLFLWFFVLFYQGNSCCPVNSFTKYTAKLNPSDPNLRQKKPVNEVSETKPVWYDNNEQKHDRDDDVKHQ